MRSVTRPGSTEKTTRTQSRNGEVWPKKRITNKMILITLIMKKAKNILKGLLALAIVFLFTQCTENKNTTPARLLLLQEEVWKA